MLLLILVILLLIIEVLEVLLVKELKFSALKVSKNDFMMPTVKERRNDYY